MLRGDNSVLASDTFSPGAWGAGNHNLDAGLQGTLSYTGDGTGNVRLRIGPDGAIETAANFEGEIDNLTVAENAGPNRSTDAYCLFRGGRLYATGHGSGDHVR